MKIKNLLMYGVVAFAFLATSCEKDSEETKDDFSPIPVEQHKANIEDAGYEMLDEMKAMESEPAIQTNISLVSYINMSAPFKNTGNSIVHPSKSLVFAPVYASANYKQTGMKGMLKSVLVNPADDPTSIQEVYDELVGIYEWNFDYEEWSYIPTGDKIVLLFPSEENGTTNNASYTVSYTGYNGTNPIRDNEDFGYDGDLPQNVSVKLVVDDVEISAYLLDIVYNSNGYPTSIETSFSMGEYKLSAMAANADNKAFDTEASFTHGSKILLKFVLGASGDWNDGNIEANTHYYIEQFNENTWEWVKYEVSANDNYDYSEIDIHKVIKNGNASFQAMNLKVTGNVDALKLGEKMKEIDAAYDWDAQEEAVNAQVEAMNSYVSLSLRYADSDKVIALVEAYPVSDEYTWQDWVWNENTQDYDIINVTETDYWMDMRFVFADDSKVDFETYFSDSFSDLENSIQDWADELNDTYGKK